MPSLDYARNNRETKPILEDSTIPRFELFLLGNKKRKVIKKLNVHE